MNSTIHSIKLFKQFLDTKSRHEPSYSEIARELDKIQVFLNSRRLNVAIFSQFPILSEALSNIFSKHQTLSQFYNPVVADFSRIQGSIPNSTPTLTLISNSYVGQQQDQYKLTANQCILIGRDLQYQNDDRLLHVPLPMYNKVSGRHAEIQSVTNFSTSSVSWQVCDLNSTNGTFINGQKIKGCQILKSGDKITLAYSTASEKSPEFVFEDNVTSYSESPSNSVLANADLVFLAIHPTQGLAPPEQQLIEQVSKVQIFGFAIIADISGTKPEQAPSIRANLSSIQTRVQSQFLHLADSLEIISLPLAPFYPNIPLAPLGPEIAQIFSEFAAPFIELAKNQGTELFEDRINQQLQVQIQRTEQIINAQETRLKQEMQRAEDSLERCSIEYWQDRIISARKQADEAKEDFFREARARLSRSRDDFATEFIPNNLLQKIDAFINRLEPVVNRVNEQVCIQLKSQTNQDLHMAAMSFCRSELEQWGNQHWEHICHTINGEGLEGLKRKTYQELNCLPGFHLTNSFSSTPSSLNFFQHFQINFNEAQADISYSESSGDAFGGVAKIAMLTASTAITAAAGSPYAIIQGVSAVSALGSFIGGSLSRPQQQTLKLEQVCDSLRRVTINHYRNIGRYLLTRIAQEIDAGIAMEERNFRQARNTFDDQIARYFRELENIGRGYRERQETLKKDRAAFEQIKRLGA